MFLTLGFAESLYDYFSQFGEVAECTVMRDGASGRSRGFGFLTFRDPKVVNTVMVKEHFLDGKIVRPTLCEESREKQVALGSLPAHKLSPKRYNKITGLRCSPQIDPKRAIPRDEQEKTSKIFVGGVSQEATEADFTNFFAQFGRVVDATLMMDKDTGRPRGFGFVTFDSEAAVDRCLQHVPLEIMNKPIEVKKAQPRGKMGEEDHHQQNQGRNKFGHGNNFHQNSNQMNPMQNMMGGNSMTPQMMAQYWQKMQQYFAMVQQQTMAANMGGMGMGQMNPQMMAQMHQMQMQNGMGNMNPQMQQQMMMQMQNGGMGTNASPGRSGFSAAEQQAFEQRKYEQQVTKRHHGGKNSFSQSPQQQSSQVGPQSWEGMYDGEPQPDTGSNSGRGSVGPGAVRSGPAGKGGKATPQPSNAPANAPTGPKNAGKPGANFRGGRGGRYHPYGR